MSNNTISHNPANLAARKPASPPTTSATTSATDVARSVVEIAYPGVAAGWDAANAVVGAAKAIGTVASADVASATLGVGDTVTTELNIKGSGELVYGKVGGAMSTERTEDGYDVSMSLSTGAGIGAELTAGAAEHGVAIEGGGVVSTTVTFGAKTAAEADARRAQLAESAALGVARTLLPTSGLLALTSSFDRDMKDAKEVKSELTLEASAELSLFEEEGFAEMSAALTGEYGASMIVTNDDGKKQVTFEGRASAGAELGVDVGGDMFTMSRSGGSDATVIVRKTMPLDDNFDMAKASNLVEVLKASAGKPVTTQYGVELTADTGRQVVEGELFVDGGAREALQVARALVTGDPSVAKGVKVEGEVTRSTKAQLDVTLEGHVLEIDGGAGTSKRLDKKNVGDAGAFLKTFTAQSALASVNLNALR